MQRPDVNSPTTAAPTIGTGRRLIPLVEWPAHHSWPPVGGLRHLVRHREVNGFEPVVRRVGGRVLIDEAAFFAWADGRVGRAEAMGGTDRVSDDHRTPLDTR